MHAHVVSLNLLKAGSPRVQVAEVVGKSLQGISSHVRVIPKHLIKSICDSSNAKKFENLVVARPAGALDPLVAEQVEVTLSGMVDACNKTLGKILRTEEEG